MIVYKATSPSGKIYIGITSKSLKNRIKEHNSKANRGVKTAFANCIRHYSIYDISFEIIDTAETWEELCEKEIYWIEYFNSLSPNGYNLTKGGEGSFGRIDSEKTKQKKRESIQKTLESKGILNRKKRFEKKLKELNMTKEEYITHTTSKISKDYFSSKENREKHAKTLGAKRFLVFKKNNGEFVGEWLNLNECARDLSCIQTMISRCLNGKTKHHHGYIFKYKDNA